MQTIADFAERYGCKAIVRRHFDYVNPLSRTMTASGAVSGLGGALGYARVIDPAKLGLSYKGVQDAFEQGRKLVQMDVRPSCIIHGLDQRNYDGARFTAEGIKDESGIETECCASPAVTYPVYKEHDRLAMAMKESGDVIVHQHMAGQLPAMNLWTEEREVFEARITAAVKHVPHDFCPVLFDLNFEQLLLLHYRHVVGCTLDEIPYDDTAWVPTKGGGIVYGAGVEVAEFNPDLSLVPDSLTMRLDM